MSTQAQLQVLVNTLIESGVDQDKVSSLQESFNDEQVEAFLGKLSSFEGLDALIDNESDCTDQSNQLIDLVSELIINK
ncbi:MAG: hypothetical protein AB8B89_00470 [Gammaproteobacteria bacterium]